jgi:hypothetical protein
MAVAMLTYAGENLTINRSDKKKIESAEMKFLRSVAGYTLLDHKRSTDIRSELKIFNLTERVENQKENCHEHILRMTTDRFPKVLLNYKPREYRNIGDPWLDGKTHSLEVRNRPAACILEAEGGGNDDEVRRTFDFERD